MYSIHVYNQRDTLETLLENKENSNLVYKDFICVWGSAFILNIIFFII